MLDKDHFYWVTIRPMMRVMIVNVFTFSLRYIFSRISRILVDFANLNTREIFF